MWPRLITVSMLLVLVGCDEPPNNTELCRDVYDALCHRAESCRGEDFVLQDCIAHYSESCRVRALHESVPEPEGEEVQACLDAVAEIACTNLDPSTLAECSFLEPVPPADADGDVDADADGDVDADGDGDGDVDADS